MEQLAEPIAEPASPASIAAGTAAAAAASLTATAMAPFPQPFQQPGPAPFAAFAFAGGLAFHVGRFAFVDRLAFHMSRLAFVDRSALMDRFAFVDRSALVDRFAFMNRPAFHLLFTDWFARDRFTLGLATVVMEPSANPVTKTLVVTTGIAPAVTRRHGRDRRGWGRLIRGLGRIGAREPGRRY